MCETANKLIKRAMWQHALQHGVTCVSIDVDGHSTENAGAWTILLFLSGGIEFKLLIQLRHFGSHVAALQTRRRATTGQGVRNPSQQKLGSEQTNQEMYLYQMIFLKYMHFLQVFLTFT